MKLKITLIKSTIGRHENQIRTVKALGLKKIGDSTVQPDNPCTRGKLAKIGYLVQVTEEQ